MLEYLEENKKYIPVFILRGKNTRPFSYFGVFNTTLNRRGVLNRARVSSPKFHKSYYIATKFPRKLQLALKRPLSFFNSSADTHVIPLDFSSYYSPSIYASSRVYTRERSEEVTESLKAAQTGIIPDYMAYFLHILRTHYNLPYQPSIFFSGKAKSSIAYEILTKLIGSPKILFTIINNFKILLIDHHKDILIIILISIYIAIVIPNASPREVTDRATFEFKKAENFVEATHFVKPPRNRPYPFSELRVKTGLTSKAYVMKKRQEYEQKNFNAIERLIRKVLNIFERVLVISNKKI
jgi:hypothetical protein